MTPIIKMHNKYDSIYYFNTILLFGFILSYIDNLILLNSGIGFANLAIFTLVFMLIVIFNSVLIFSLPLKILENINFITFLSGFYGVLFFPFLFTGGAFFAFLSALILSGMFLYFKRKYRNFYKNFYQIAGKLFLSIIFLNILISIFLIVRRFFDVTILSNTVVNLMEITFITSLIILLYAFRKTVILLKNKPDT